MSRPAVGALDLFEQEQRARDDRVLVSAGRAAQMLRVTRHVVRWFHVTGQLEGEVIEGVHRDQVVFCKGELRRFLLQRAFTPRMLKAGLRQGETRTTHMRSESLGFAERFRRRA